MDPKFRDYIKEYRSTRQTGPTRFRSAWIRGGRSELPKALAALIQLRMELEMVWYMKTHFHRQVFQTFIIQPLRKIKKYSNGYTNSLITGHLTMS